MNTVPTYFRVVNTAPNAIIISGKHGTVKFHQLDFNKALSLWKEGFIYLAITTSGAKKWLGNKPSWQKLVGAISEARTKADIKTLASLSNTKKVNDYAKQRLQELG